MPNYNDSDLSKGFIHEEQKEETEDHLEVYREILGASEEDVKEESNVPKVKSDYIPIRLDEEPETIWTDHHEMIFKPGQLVVLRTSKRGTKVVFKVIGPHIDPGAYEIRKTEVRDTQVEFDYNLKPAAKNAVWNKFIDDPYILWKMEQEKKNK